MQKFYALKLAEEKKIKVKKIEINHYLGETYINNKKYNLLFPEYMISKLNDLSKEKKIDYFFSGLITKHREWIKDFKENTIIQESTYGKNRATKYKLDMDYYTKMSMSKFTLCPIGDCPWSYRFFEAIMCKSIPILGDNEKDILSDGYFFYRKSDKHIYDETKVEYNYKKFLEKNKI